MIIHPFTYIQPDTKEQAYEVYQEYSQPLYYAGGSEIITMCRTGSITPDAVIDLKRIPEANVVHIDDDLVIGSCISLRAIKDSALFPLLGTICGRIADHTNQCRITLGGNLCSTIQYRETALAMLLTDANLVLFGSHGLRVVSIHTIFDGRMHLERGEFVLQVRIPTRYINLPYTHVKKTSGEKIDYPLISVSSLTCSDGTRFAISGFLNHPFRNREMEAALNQRNLDDALECIPGVPKTDYQGSSEYRRFVLQQTLTATLDVIT